jgi:hypothetical protein
MIAITEFSAPTQKNSKLWQSPEKEWFQSNGRPSGSFNEDYSFTLRDQEGRELRLWFRFYVTSFSASVHIRGCECPEAFTIPGFEPTQSFESLAFAAWGQNGSGLNQKYVEARALIEETVNGEWDAWCPLVQENRSTSRNARTGEPSTRFWAAQQTDPAVAQRRYAFPLIRA